MPYRQSDEGKCPRCGQVGCSVGCAWNRPNQNITRPKWRVQPLIPKEAR